MVGAGGGDLGHHLGDRLRLGGGAELRQHDEALQVAADAGMTDAHVGGGLVEQAVHVLAPDGLGDRAREVVHLARNLHPRRHHDRLLLGGAADENAVAGTAERELHVVHRHLPDAVLLGKQRGEEALLAELLHQSLEHQLGRLVVAELEAGFARVVRGRARMPHAPCLRGEEPDQRRRRDDGGDERHQDADAEDLLGEKSARKAETGNDERHLAARHHAGADAEAAKDVEAAAHRRHHAPDHLRRDRNRGVDAAKNEHRLGTEGADIDHHAHGAEEHRHQEGVDRGKHLLDRVLEVGAGERQAHHVRADDHRQAHVLEEARQHQRQTEGHRRDHHRTLERLLEELGDPPRRKKRNRRRPEPDAERLERDKPDLAPVHAASGRPGGLRRLVRRDDAVADGKHDEAKDVVDHRAGHDGDALLGVHLLLLGKDARGDANRSGGGHDAHVERGRLGHRLGQRDADKRVGAALGEHREEPRQQHDRAEVAEDKRHQHAAKTDHQPDKRVLEEHLDVRLQPREKEENHRRQSGDAVELVPRRVDQPPGAGNLPEGGAVEKPAREKPVAEADAAERPGTDHDARAEFAENRGELQHRRDRPAQPRGENDDTDLQHEEHHLLHARQTEVGIGFVLDPAGGIRAKRRQRERDQ